MFRYSFAVLGLVALAAACGTAEPPRTLPASLDAGSLPEAARAALDQKWPNKTWSVAATATQVASCMPGKPTSSVVVSDLDSDNATDIAAPITTPQGTQLVALLQRDDHYAVYDLGPIDVTTTGLGLSKRGAPFVKADTLFHDFYGSDTLTTFTCNGASTSYLWGGLDFYKVALAPGPK
jgi:hypothetical protein